MSFCTVINCMDGRVQLPVIKYLQDYFKVEYVDTITEAGPNLILAEQSDSNSIESILHRLQISLIKHGSVGLAIVGHYNCAGNPESKETQNIHTLNAIKYIKRKFSNIEIIGLWVDESHNISQITP